MKLSALFNRRENRPPYPPNTFPTEPKPKRSNRWTLLLIIITLASLGLGGFYYTKYQRLKNAPPSMVSEAEAKELEKKVARLIVLPPAELPTIATVSDYSQLKDQPFFSKSNNGDKLLIYTKAKIVILYSPGQDKIINVGPLTVEDQSQKALK